MAEDNKTFRQQRQGGEPMSQNEPDTLKQIRNVQQLAGGNVSGAGLEIKGNMPPGMMEALQREAQSQEEDDFSPQMQAPQMQAPQQTMQRKPQQTQPTQNTDPRSVGNPVDADFEALVAGARSTTQIYDEIVLPSLGRFYDGTNGPINGVLHIKPMTGEEEQILATQRYVKRGVAMNMIFEKCVREKIKADRLLSVDRTYLLIYLRSLSYSTLYEVQIKCPECSSSFNYTIDLDELPINRCPSNFSLDDLVDKLPTCGYEFTYRLANGTDENIISEHRERRNKAFGDSAIDDSLLFKTSLLVQSISNGQNTINNSHIILELLKRLPINDVAYIRSVVNDPPFGVDTEVPIQCPSCSNEFEVDLPIEAGFFFPKMRTERK